MTLERGLDDAALDAGAAAVNQANFAQAGGVRGADVLVDDRTDLARVERVEVERVFDWNLVWRVGVVRHRVTPPSIRVRPWVPPAAAGFSYEAVTTVLIPPRTEKSPITVMRLGLQTSTSSSRIRFVTAS